jgi:hypothetical protein
MHWPKPGQCIFFRTFGRYSTSATGINANGSNTMSFGCCVYRRRRLLASGSASQQAKESSRPLFPVKPKRLENRPERTATAFPAPDGVLKEHPMHEIAGAQVGEAQGF